MSKWISGSEVLKKWDIKPIELYECVRKGLQPYNQLGEPIADPATIEKQNKLPKLEKELKAIHHCLKEPKNLRETIIANSREGAGFDDKNRRIVLEDTIKSIKKELSGTDSSSWKDYQISCREDEALSLLNDLTDYYYMKKDLEEFENKYLSSLSDNDEKIHGKGKSNQSIEESSTDQIDEFLIQFYKEGQNWVFGNKGFKIILSDLKGLKMLQLLIKNSDKEEGLNPVQVYYDGVIPDALKYLREPSNQKITDPKAINSVKDKIKDFKIELGETTDINKKDILREKIEHCNNYLNEWKGTFKSGQFENIRTTVQKRIKKAVETIIIEYEQALELSNSPENVLPVKDIFCLENPKRTIQTGNLCRYIPNPSLTIDWKLDP